MSGSHRIAEPKLGRQRKVSRLQESFDVRSWSAPGFVSVFETPRISTIGTGAACEPGARTFVAGYAIPRNRLIARLPSSPEIAICSAGCIGHSATITLSPAPGSPPDPTIFQCSPASGAACGQSLSALWLDPRGERGCAVGNDGVVLRYEYSRWKRDDAAFADSGGDKLNSLWLDPNGDCGWAVSGGGEVFRNHRPASRSQKPDEQRLWRRRFISRRVDLDRRALSSGLISERRPGFPKAIK